VEFGFVPITAEVPNGPTIYGQAEGGFVRGKWVENAGRSGGILSGRRNMNGKSDIAGLSKLLEPPGLPELGPGPRPDVLPQKELASKLDDSLTAGNLPQNSRELVRGLVLLWHDHMDAAHEIAQAIEDADGSFLHGILHRREPDYGNAAYWFRRVGRHECFPEIAKRTAELLKAKGDPGIEKKLLGTGQWNPHGFIELCEKVSGKSPDDASVMLLREIQAIETEVLLEAWGGRPESGKN
jgi:hypothetical protein